MVSALRGRPSEHAMGRSKPSEHAVGLVCREKLSSTFPSRACVAGVQCHRCLCRDCFNTPENAEFLKAEQAKTVARNPQAFTQKVRKSSQHMLSAIKLKA